MLAAKCVAMAPSFHAAETVQPTGPPFIETTYPGQTKRTIKAPRHIYEHFLKHPESELPFIEPVGEFKQWLEIYREDRRKARDMFERDEAGRRRDGVAAS